MATDDGPATVHELIKDQHTCMLSTISPDGAIVSRPMATQQTEFDGDLWFFAAADSAKAIEIQRNPRVNAAYAGTSTWVSLSGTASIVRDRAKARELWNPVVEAWFPEGPEDENVVLIHVEADTAEYWDTPGGRVASVISLVKAKVTGKPYDGGENETVQL